MPKFSMRSLERLNTCDVDLQDLFLEVIKHFDCSVICGTRSMDEQNEAFNKGFSKVKYPNSKHNSLPSKAADVCPYPIEWENTDRMKFFIGFVLGVASQMGIEVTSGIDWDGDTFIKDTHFMDHPHFQLKN